MDDSTINSLYKKLRKLRTDAVYKIETEADRIFNENKQDTLIKKIDKRWEELGSPYPSYPYYTQSDFNAKLSSIPDFAVWTSAPSLQKNTEFRHTDAQNFARTFIHPQSPYNSLILWHGTGVGKTCTAIGIAEQFKNTIYARGKKIWIVCPKSLVSGWYNEIFNILKAVHASKSTNARNANNASNATQSMSSSQCTGSIYTSVFKVMSEDLDDNIPLLERRMKLFINKYYRIMNYEKFVQVIEGIRNHSSDSEGKKIMEIKKEFSNALLIVDEAHYLRKKSSTTPSSVNTLASIRSVKVAKGTEVLVYPMRNKRKSDSIPPLRLSKSSPKIEFIIGKQTIGGVRIKRVKGSGKVTLFSKSRYKGRSFDLPVESKEYVIPKTSKSIVELLKYVTRHSDMMKLLLLTATPMYNQKEEIVELINLCRLNDSRPTFREKDIFSVSNNLPAFTKALHTFSRGYISYVRGEDPRVFPQLMYPTYRNNPNIKEYDTVFCVSDMTDSQLQLLKARKASSDIDSARMTISTAVYDNQMLNNDAFHRLFYSSNRSPPFKQPLTFGRNKTMFHESVFKMISPKYCTLMNHIRRCKGIVFVYTEFMFVGAYLIAMMLEENGYVRRGSDFPMLSNKARKGKSVGGYVLFDSSTPESIQRWVNLINHPQNKNGQHVKVIIGTRRIEQGISFRNVRQIHIMTPWFNMNRNKQIIGRGSRTFSHHDLPSAMRNVTVFYHVCKHAKTKFSSDLQMYEAAIQKQRDIETVENILKTNSIDCVTYSEINQFQLPSSGSNQYIKDSYGKRRRRTQKVKVSNMPRYTCEAEVTETKMKIENVNIDKIGRKLENVAKDISTRIFTSTNANAITFDALARNLTPFFSAQKIDVRVLPLILQHIIEKNVPVFSGKMEGNLVWHDGFYVFIPRRRGSVTSTAESKMMNPFLPLIYRKIIPRRVARFSKPIVSRINDGTMTELEIRNSKIQKIVERAEGIVGELEQIESYIAAHYNVGDDVEYTTKQMKSFITQRKYVFLDEQNYLTRKSVLYTMCYHPDNEKLKPYMKLLIAFFGTSTSPSKIDKMFGIIDDNGPEGKRFFRCVNYKTGEWEYFDDTFDKPISKTQRRQIEARLLSTGREKKLDLRKDVFSFSKPHIGFRQYTAKGESVFKVVTAEHNQNTKKHRYGCRCDRGPALGKKPNIVRILGAMKKYFSEKKLKVDKKIQQGTRVRFKKRTLCEEMECLLRAIRHKDVRFFSLREAMLRMGVKNKK